MLPLQGVRLKGISLVIIAAWQHYRRVLCKGPRRMSRTALWSPGVAQTMVETAVRCRTLRRGSSQLFLCTIGTNVVPFLEICLTRFVWYFWPVAAKRLQKDANAANSKAYAKRPQKAAARLQKTSNQTHISANENKTTKTPKSQNVQKQRSNKSPGLLNNLSPAHNADSGKGPAWVLISILRTSTRQLSPVLVPKDFSQ